MKQYTHFHKRQEYKELVESVKNFLGNCEKWEIGEVLDEIISEMIVAKSYKDEDGNHGLHSIKLECKYNTCSIGSHSYVKKYKENGFFYKRPEQLPE